MPDLSGTYKGRTGHPRDCDCTVCLEEYAEHFETVLLADRLAQHDPERSHGAKPATDQEWAEFWDAEFPRVRGINGHILVTKGDGHKHDEDRQCPVCDGGLSVCRDCGAYEAGLDDPCPRVKEGARA